MRLHGRVRVHVVLVGWRLRNWLTAKAAAPLPSRQAPSSCSKPSLTNHEQAQDAGASGDAHQVVREQGGQRHHLQRSTQHGHRRWGHEGQQVTGA